MAADEERPSDVEEKADAPTDGDHEHTLSDESERSDVDDARKDSEPVPHQSEAPEATVEEHEHSEDEKDEASAPASRPDVPPVQVQSPKDEASPPYIPASSSAPSTAPAPSSREVYCLHTVRDH